MPEPLVSCIVPVYNGERYLVETLDSLFGQSHAAVEVIVVDDGSTDGSSAVAGSHPGEPVCISQPRGGHASARNRGLDEARGEFIAFLDADDLWHREKLERQLARFAARPELGVVFAHLENFQSPDVEAPPEGPPSSVPVPGYTSVAMLARRAAFDRVGPFDQSLSHGNDRDWFCRAAEHRIEMEMLPDVLVRRRLHGANRSTPLGRTSRGRCRG